MSREEMAHFLDELSINDRGLCLLCKNENNKNLDTCTYACPDTEDLLDEEWTDNIDV